MSHTILYSRLFVKMSDGKILPFVKAGDNNVYDVNPRTGREVRPASGRPGTCTATRRCPPARRMTSPHTSNASPTTPQATPTAP